ncbi:hypothetical protein PMI21_05357 [Pseudomonas sp. GM18]|uniref:hypothetical protein n=1 Tax=Pseudomonas sp. GM18 TaxID=1144324 RepID=UPI000272311E|nr:hypothetical protein [Pseudomonas sp. GM18]EJM10052.1 hypothetical protein PMI21_05357 [Pseudomonas sp. GM18]
MTNLSENSNAATQVLVFSTDPNLMGVLTGVLTDVPPLIPGGKSLANNVTGVNRNMVNSDRRGLLGYIFPYFNMASTDEIRLYLGPRPTPVGGLFSVGQYVDQLVPFYIPADLLAQMYASPVPMPDALSLYFSVKRPSENEKNSPSLPLLYKPFGPGEADTRLDLPNNQGLALPIPSETVIDKTVIENGMFVAVPRYEHQAIGDVVYLAVGPRELKITVTALGDLLFELTPDFLASLPNTDKVALTYEIWDIVENGSGWSSAVFLALKPTEQLLIAPVIDQAEPGNPDNLKHHALNGETATVLLNEQFTAGDVVVLTIVLSTAVGDRVERVIPLDVRSSTRSLRIDLENEFIQNGIRGSMILSYTRQRAGDIRHSKSYTVTLSGLVLPAPAPTIDEQKDEELPADTSPAHVRIPKYWPLVNGATVELYWQVTGTDGVAHLFIFRQVIVDATQPVIFTVNNDYIDRYESSPLTVLYKIENPGKAVVQSEMLQITIGAAAELPAPTLIQESPGNLIQPLNTRYAATVRVTDPAMSSRKRYTLTVRGRPGLGSPVVGSQSGNSSGELHFDLPPTCIPANMGNYVKFGCTATEVGKPDQPSAVRRYKVLPVTNEDINYPRLSIKEVSDNKVLNLNTFTGDAHWTLPPYLFIAAGTSLRVALSGNDAQHVIMLFEGKISANHVRDGLSGTISREQLKRYKDGTQVFGLSIADFNDQGGVDTFFPMLELTIKTEMLARPSITQLIDNQPPIVGQVVNGGTCDDPTPLVIGTATPKSVVHLFNGATEVTTVIVDDNGIWTKEVNVGFGRHTLTAKTPDGQQVSNTWTVTVAADLGDLGLGALDLNGWLATETGGRYGGYGRYGTGNSWDNWTPGGAIHSGIMLYKELPLKIGASYRFTAHVRNITGSAGRHQPIFNLFVFGYMDSAPFTPPRNSVAYAMSGDFTATTNTGTFYIRNFQGTPDGNDTSIALIEVRQLTNGTSG